MMNGVLIFSCRCSCCCLLLLLLLLLRIRLIFSLHCELGMFLWLNLCCLSWQRQLAMSGDKKLAQQPLVVCLLRLSRRCRCSRISAFLFVCNVVRNFSSASWRSRRRKSKSGKSKSTKWKVYDLPK